MTHLPCHLVTLSPLHALWQHAPHNRISRSTISRWRMNAVLLVAVLVIGGVALRLGNLQIVQHESLSQPRARRDQPAAARSRRAVAPSATAPAMCWRWMWIARACIVVPQQIDQQNAPRLALMLSGLLGRPAPEILAALQDQSNYWVPLKRWLDPEIAKQIARAGRG